MASPQGLGCHPGSSCLFKVVPRDRVPTAGGLERLIEALRILPGVGPRSAQRIAYHVLQHDRAGADRLAQALLEALRTVRHCVRCNNFAEEEACALYRSARRDAISRLAPTCASRPLPPCLS